MPTYSRIGQYSMVKKAGIIHRSNEVAVKKKMRCHSKKINGYMEKKFVKNEQVIVHYEHRYFHKSITHMLYRRHQNWLQIPMRVFLLLFLFVHSFYSLNLARFYKPHLLFRFRSRAIVRLFQRSPRRLPRHRR